ncbi:MAG: hypothetical protein ABI398_15740 [Devosia sp.]
MSPLDPALAARLQAALAVGPAQLFAVLNGLFTALPGVRTVTWLAARPAEKITLRVGTSDPVNFPLGGSDPIDEAAWSRQIYGDKQFIVGNTPAEMSAFIPETEDLVKLGYGSTLCAPIVIAGEARGTVNLLGDANIFTPALLAELDALLPIAALIFTFEEIAAR